MGNYVNSDLLIDKLNTANMRLKEVKNRIFNYKNIDYLFELIIETIKVNTISIDTTKNMNATDDYPGQIHAYWMRVEVIDDDYPSGVNDDAAECSNCLGVESSYEYAKHNCPYCKHCGAKMDAKGSGNDGS